MRVKIKAINLKTVGQVIQPSDGVTLIVGPNNVGKSAILAGVNQEISSEPSQPLNNFSQLVASVEVVVPRDENYLASLVARAKLVAAGAYPQGTYYEPTYVFPTGQAISQSYLAGALSRSDHFGQVSGVLMNFMGPEGRGGVLNAQGVPDLMNQMARTPIQLLWESRELESTMDAYMQRAFSKRLFVNRHAGASVYLQIGQVSIDEPRLGERSQYLEEAMRLPQLSAQGSGMQAFMGTMLTLAAGSFDIVLLDEPEAFLHPPQARLLGEVVAEMSRKSGLQVIAATHSDDFVQGVLGASGADVSATVVRLTRPSDTENRVAQVEPAAIKSLYRDPLLRYSNIIDGIFYKGAVLCESESDCTYYSATLAHIEESKSLGASDLFFTQCSGKDRFDRAYNALAAAAVPTAVIADIDLLADEAKFSTLFAAMGGDFAVIEASYNILNSSVKTQKLQPKRDQVREAVVGVLDASTTTNLNSAELSKISTAIRAESGWKQIKRKGSGSIDSGNPTAAFNSVIAACKGLGLFIVEVGELERFHSDIPSGNKQEWLRQVLEGELFKTLPAAHKFIEDVRDYISSHQ